MSGFYLRHPNVMECVTIHRLFNASTRTRVEFARTKVLRPAAVSDSMAKYWGQNSELRRESLIITIDRRTSQVPAKSYDNVLSAENLKELSLSCMLNAWSKFNSNHIDTRMRIDDTFMKLDQVLARAIGATPPGFYLVRTENIDLQEFAQQRTAFVRYRLLRHGISGESNWVGILQEYLSMLAFNEELPKIDIRDQSEYYMTENGVTPLRPIVKFIGTEDELKKFADLLAERKIQFETIVPQLRPIKVHFSSDYDGNHASILSMGDAAGALPALRVSDQNVINLAAWIIQDIKNIAAAKGGKLKSNPGP